MKYYPHVLVIPAEGNSIQSSVDIPFGSKSRIAMRGKVFKIYLIKGTYHYTFKRVSFYRSKDLDIHIINILANSVAINYVEPNQKQMFIANLIKSRIERYKRKYKL